MEIVVRDPASSILSFAISYLPFNAEPLGTGRAGFSPISLPLSP